MRNIKEEAYDSRIQPLIERMAEIAKEYDISLVVAADIGRDDFDRPQVASTVLLFDGCHDSFWRVKHLLFDGYRITPPKIEEDLPSEEIAESGILPDYEL